MCVGMFHVELISYCPQCQRPAVDCLCEWNDYIKEDQEDYDDVYDPAELELDKEQFLDCSNVNQHDAK